MYKTSSLLTNFLVYLPAYLLAVYCFAGGVAEAQETSYFDCAYIKFDDVDPSILTLQEHIDLEEAAFFASLDDSATCMEEASESAAGNLADAASDADVDSDTNFDSDSSESSSQVTSEEQQQSTSSKNSVNTKDQERGDSGSGSSAVCDAVKEGMVSATTEAEEEHFKGLMAEYGCQ